MTENDMQSKRRSHPAFLQPDDVNIRIWRYMDLAKYLALLQSRTLFFPRANLLGDPFEGSVPRANEAVWQVIRELRKSNPELSQGWDKVDDGAFEAMRKQTSDFFKSNVERFFVSCWHENQKESAAMWRLYSESTFAVAIQSTYSTLVNSLPSWVDVGRVKYIDYATTPIAQGNILYPIMHKRHSFEHECEVRAVAWEMLGGPIGGDEIRKLMTPAGIPIAVEPEKLIEKVFVSPFAPVWFTEVVHKATKCLFKNIPVHQSSLRDSPFY
jgi:hypothetical protein